MSLRNDQRYMTDEERRILNFYIAMYNNTNRRIEYLYDSLDIIRSNIDNLVFNSRLRNESLTNRINSPLISRRSVVYNIPTFHITEENNSTISELFSGLLSELYNDRLTQEQIETAVRRIRFGDIEYPLNISCPINLEMFNIDDNVSQIIYCGHIFFTESINRWLETNSECPVCRYRIDSASVIAIPASANPNRASTNPNRASANPNRASANPNRTSANPNRASANPNRDADELSFTSDNIYSRLDSSNNTIFYTVYSELL